MSQSEILGSPPRLPAASLMSLVLVLAGWCAGITVLSVGGVFDTPGGALPWPTVLALIVPPGAFGGLYLTLPRFRRFVLGLDTRTLILLHTWRMVGLGFLFLAAYGILPFAFAIPAGIGDALAAIGAVYLVATMKRPSVAADARWIRAWNGFGAADFAVAVGAGILTRSGNMGSVLGAVDSDPLGAFPLALIPAFVVPFYLVTHLVIYLQFRHGARPGAVGIATRMASC
jgi:hypothetical protein